MPNSNSIRTFLALFVACGLATLHAVAIGEDQPPQSARIKPVRREAPFQAYWIDGPKQATEAGYQRLLVTHGPIEDLAGHTRWSTLPFDNMAMTFETYKRDSLWDKPFTIIERIGRVDNNARTAVVDDVITKYEPCPIDDVIRLLEKPLGTKPLHRRVDPLQAAEQTARAFRLLLQEQVRPSNPTGKG